MKKSEVDHTAAYMLDMFTNHFLAEYPIHCEHRTSPLGQRLLHSHHGYEFYLCLQGSGFYIVGDRLYPLHAGTLTVIRPHVIHRPYSEDRPLFSRYVLAIDESYLTQINAICRSSALRIGDLLTVSNTDSSHFFLSVQQLHRLETLLEGLALLLHSRETNYELKIIGCLADFFLNVIELANNPLTARNTKTEDEQIIGDVLAYLITHYQEDMQIDYFLERFPISRSRLFDLFKKTTGCTIMQFLIEYRLNRAKHMLTETDLTITEVAGHTGFNDMSHFFHMFKRETGFTPRQFRQETHKRKKGYPIIPG
ncbi:AraC family transcriptional regulator [Paenibacillus sp. N3.4]|uniref:AraC family transcriptional regulator n=1 Tax=Paenibacillus sp. N3.4 TaxID=2603222 RepID=UPI0011CC75B5|nr:AraC family transcriptional regulator [Paenibacillus sp. N3.4]TXK84163.1 AraC family transcriptional regulator [Paenibacillus sp. N3.4]